MGRIAEDNTERADVSCTRVTTGYLRWRLTYSEAKARQVMILGGTGHLRRRRLISRQARVSGKAIPEMRHSTLEDPSQYVLWRATKQMAQSQRAASPWGTLRLAPSRT